jgi:hypothetical protein
MQRLEVSCAVRPIYGSLGAKGLREVWKDDREVLFVLIKFGDVAAGFTNRRDQTMKE